ncbi:hypothetical protein Kpol_1065p3 [Vanderwaltozyma polyspora DSM 70294]|uniref:Aurora kinase n=1 Tax=Vanderwaltozyma polyspora (strain ATCC 22028 / DSM 70294 / BCRC 21397 / CBS 2163 / NBRC 10782 / NRRL Y-8283 / UCD 57-17) TaxID=436907 RepID=A7TL28_VANPO|nr:uncharacterized protein Kpol_1065p3 [Vanderwaltozyma polyspora DSM 70294]EDO16991.1 hypothetical protein Kpol_1065p3 [Vanderwaltozyma polyspora DSM 70294]
MMDSNRRQSLKQRNLLLSMRLNNNNNNNNNNTTKVKNISGVKNNSNGKVWRLSYSPRGKNNHHSHGTSSKIPSPVRNSANATTIATTTVATTGSIPASSTSSQIKGRFPMVDLKLNDFEIGRKLGKGKFGKVYCVRHKPSGLICALKVMNKMEIVNFNVQKQFKREIDIQYHLNHKNLTKLYAFFHDSKNVYLVMEYLIGGELYKLLKKNGPMNDITASNYVYQMTDALNYMHKRKIIHRDLKPENILIGFNNQIKLTDFGWSIYNPNNQKRKTLCGTIDYLSPELISSREYDENVDVWALGILTYELVVGAPPFEEDTKEQTYKRIAKSDLKFPPNVSSEARDLITNLLKVVPSERFNLQQVMNHPWIEKNKPFW